MTVDLVEPAYLSVPERVGTHGDIVADVADEAGRPLDPEQRLAVDAICSYGAGGKWAALEAAMIEGRQNGKTDGVIMPIVLADLFVWDADEIQWTAHLFRTTRKSFEEIQRIIEATPTFSRRVKKISESHGEESVELTNGATLEFLARAKGGGRGLGGKRTVLDEALYLPATSLGALIPTLSARPNPQILYGSSAGVAESVHLRALRDRGRPGGDPSLVWVEYTTPQGGCKLGDQCPHTVGTTGCKLDDESLWPQANHAIARGRITIAFVRDERRTLPPEEFARERCGWWEDPAGGDQPIDEQRWASRANQPKKRPKDVEPVFFAHVAPHSTSASIAVAYERKSGPHVELADHRAGIAWFVKRCKQLRNRHEDATWAADANGSIGALLPDLAEAGIEPELFSNADMGRACSYLEGLVADEAMTQSGDEAVVVAIRGATKRDIGDGLWVWTQRKSTSDITPLVAETGALWTLETLGGYDPLEHLHPHGGGGNSPAGDIPKRIDGRGPLPHERGGDT